MSNTDPTDHEAIIALGIETLKLIVEAIPGIPTYCYSWITT